MSYINPKEPTAETLEDKLVKCGISLPYAVSAIAKVIFHQECLEESVLYLVALHLQGHVQLVDAIIHEVVSGDEFLQTYLKDLVVKAKATYLDDQNKNQ